MSKEIDRQEIAKRYLLGELPEEERTALEERYFLDDEEFEQFEIAEDELLDRYVRNELSAEDTRRFEKLLVAPGLTERVEVARLIAKRTAAPVSQVATPVIVPPKPETVGWWDRLFGSPAAAVPGFRPAFAMSLIFLMLATVAFIFVWMKLRAESQRLAQQQQQQEQLRQQIKEQEARYNELEAKLNKTDQEKEQQAALAAEYQRLLAEKQQQGPGTAMIFPIALSPGGASRGSGGESVQAFTIQRGATQVGLKLNVTHGDDYTHYNAFVKNLDSSKPFATRSDLKPFTERGRKYITINVLAKDLPAGSYNVHLDGVTSDGRVDNFEDYPFRITSR